MSKKIAVWGSPGSGKSMFCCILAKALTRDKKKAIIINADAGTPMLPIWLPGQITETSVSIGQALTAVEIDTALVASHVTVLKDYPFIGLMGYSAGENPLSYPELRYESILQLVSAASKLVDYVILDGSSNITNIFTPAAIESADVVVRILTPDLKGVNYLKAHQPVIGGFDGLLPYSKEIDRCATEGGMFHAINYCTGKYMASLQKVMEAVCDEQTQ